VFIAPDPGAMSGYLAALRALRERPLALLCPGHGAPIADPAAKLDEYVAHRLERERRLLDALAEGRRGVSELLDSAWDDVPAGLRPAAAVTLAAHLDKLEEEGRLPDGVERPGF
jgi:glyoxylase-like metal-dependent hydrolase (beta-lactamase superfamily II)